MIIVAMVKKSMACINFNNTHSVPSPIMKYKNILHLAGDFSYGYFL